MTIRSLLESGRIVCVFLIVLVLCISGEPAVGMPPKKPAEHSGDDALKSSVEEASASAEAAESAAQTAESQPTAATSPADEEDEAEPPLLEIYIPSVTRLVTASSQSRTADISRALSGVMRMPEDETGEGFDFAALTKIFDQVAQWPDTSVAFTVFPQDRDGRALWAAELDWPVEELRTRIAALLEQDAAQQLLKDVTLEQADDGTWRVELPDVVLAVLSPRGDGSMIAASADVSPPDEIYGQEHASERIEGGKSPRLVYAQMSGDNESSPLAQIPGIKDASYYLTLGRDGQWIEGLMVRWNMLIGTGAKVLFQQTKEPFECPADAYFLAAYNFGGAQGLADSIAGMEPGVIGARAGSAVGLSVVPGTGFLPFPDVFFQFRARNKAKIIKSIRKAIEEDWQDRKADDRQKAWFEQKVGDRTIFWYDPSVDSQYGIMPVTYRTVIFFDGEEKTASDDDSKDDADKVSEGADATESSSLRLVIAQTSTWAEDAVLNWDAKTSVGASVIAVPSGKKADWQARVRWRALYALLQPYLCLLTASSEDVVLPPPPEELDAVLSDSVLNLRIHYAGLQIQHRGPVPTGGLILPGLAAMSLTSSGDASSEAARERLASRYLRILHHHAELFKKDYGRWPATVAELDGYVDFASHSYLLRLRSKEQSAGERFLSAFVSRDRSRDEEDEDDSAIDDSLYEIEWSQDDWRLKLRPGEFVHYETIYIDAEGEIHRVPKADGEDEQAEHAAIAPAGAADAPAL